MCLNSKRFIACALFENFLRTEMGAEKSRKMNVHYLGQGESMSIVGTLRSSQKVEADTISSKKANEISILKILQAFIGLLGKGLTRQIIYKCKTLTF
jgi:hypothetical protein